MLRPPPLPAASLPENVRLMSSRLLPAPLLSMPPPSCVLLFSSKLVSVSVASEESVHMPPPDAAELPSKLVSDSS